MSSWAVVNEGSGSVLRIFKNGKLVCEFEKSEFPNLILALATGLRNG
jgi:hypothetical protein